MKQFQKLMLVAVSSGALAGLVLFAVQHFTVVPLMKTAESYQTAASHDGWHPADGWERTGFTALATTLGGIGSAAILFGAVALTGKTVDARRGALWGLAAFACFDLAPALGLPPQPPGVAVAAVSERQLWWAGTALATAAGLWLLAGQGGNWLIRLGGVVCLSLPHWMGAPVAIGHTAVPAPVIRQFTIASLSTNGLFWLLLGTTGGFLYEACYTDSSFLRRRGSP